MKNPKLRNPFGLCSRILRIALCVAMSAAAALGQGVAGAPGRADGVRASVGVKQLQPAVILISIDGFRYDYPEKAATPNLHRMIHGGARAAGLIPQFPTLTFPNHYAMVTGLTPAHNGIVSNTMLDPRRHAMFKLSDRAEVNDSAWWGGEPIWVTAEKQGQRAATMFWPGSEAEIKGLRPTYWVPYDKNVSNADRVKRVLSWLDLPEAQRPTLLTLYFDEVDTAGHDYGPNSKQVKAAIEHVDAALGQLLAGLESRSMGNAIDLVVVSDHGMAETSCRRVVDLRSILARDQVILGEQGALATFYPNGTRAETLIEQLRGTPHVTVYRSDETPLRWNYRGNDRIAPVIAVADEGWTIETRPPTHEPPGCIAGTHGYDNFLPSQQGIFIAYGPDIRAGSEIPAFDNLDVYSVLVRLLHLTPAVTDGSLAPVEGILLEGLRATPKKE
jgi:predicted AlkP superfamily pyrophosphatase or phosphodiesterase